MATIHYDADVDPALIRDRRVAVLGYGSQGHAHALNLRDSGVDVRVGLRPGSSSREAAGEQGLTVADTDDAAAEGDVIVVLAPDTAQKGMWEGGLAEAVTPGDVLIFGHGFNVHYDLIQPPEGVGVVLIAPKAPGHTVRRLYEQGSGTPGLVAVEQGTAGDVDTMELAKSYGAALGLTRAGLIETTFAEETETDLFGEQAVLCGGLSHLATAGFETLVEAGYQPEVAYFECVHELKLIIDMIYEGGLSWMRNSVSTTAEYGDYVAGPEIIGRATREAMQDRLEAVRDGSFARRWVDEFESGETEFRRMRREARDHEIERVGRRLRELMPFIDQPSEDELE